MLKDLRQTIAQMIAASWQDCHCHPAGVNVSPAAHLSEGHAADSADPIDSTCAAENAPSMALC